MNNSNSITDFLLTVLLLLLIIGIIVIMREIAMRRRRAGIGHVSPVKVSPPIEPAPLTHAAPPVAEIMSPGRAATQQSERTETGDQRQPAAARERKAEQEYDVFISYRRGTGAETARLLRSELRHNNLRVFLDIDDLRPGHFDQALLRCITNTPNFILILSPHCLDNCADEEDWLRLEIAQAVKTNRNIVPIMMPNFQFPEAEHLPTDIRVLRTHQSVSYSHEFFDAMIAKIIRYLTV